MDEGVRVPPPAGIPQETKHSLNAYGKDIWIEKEDEYTGKPILWYSLDSKGRRQKHERDSNGIRITRDKDPDKLE